MNKYLLLFAASYHRVTHKMSKSIKFQLIIHCTVWSVCTTEILADIVIINN